MSSSLRAASTVTTTARWEGTITPMWPYLPATGCSKWTAELCLILARSEYLWIHSSLLLLTQYRLSSLPSRLSLPGSGMFDDGVYMYLIEPLQQTHSIVSHSCRREPEYVSHKGFVSLLMSRHLHRTWETASTLTAVDIFTWRCPTKETMKHVWPKWFQHLIECSGLSSSTYTQFEHCFKVDLI